MNQSRTNREETGCKIKVDYYSILIIFAIIIFFICVAMIDGNRFVVKEYLIESEKVKSDVRFVVLSDLHNKSYSNHNRQLIRTIKKISPDGILVAGDMVTAKPGRENKSAISLIRILSRNFPIYYANGNHEYRMKIYPDTYPGMYETYQNAIAHKNLHYLCNETVPLFGKNITISGLEIDRKYYKRIRKDKMPSSYLKEVLGAYKSDTFHILLAHNPEYFEHYAGWGADLTLSGHVHGGIMKLPGIGGVISPGFRLFPKYDGGLFQKGEKKMIVSRGLGMHTIHMRIFNPGELVVVSLKAK